MGLTARPTSTLHLHPRIHQTGTWAKSLENQPPSFLIRSRFVLPSISPAPSIRFRQGIERYELFFFFFFCRRTCSFVDDCWFCRLWFFVYIVSILLNAKMFDYFCVRWHLVDWIIVEKIMVNIFLIVCESVGVMLVCFGCCWIWGIGRLDSRWWYCFISRMRVLVNYVGNDFCYMDAAMFDVFVLVNSPLWAVFFILYAVEFDACIGKFFKWRWCLVCWILLYLMNVLVN